MTDQVVAEREAYRLAAQDVLASQGTDPRQGLSEEEARARLERHGPNELATEPPVPAWRRFLAQFSDVLVQLLLVAAAVSIALWVVERDSPLPYEGLAILAIVLLNAVLGYVQEASAERSVAALREMSAAQASVIRGGRRRAVPTAELVPGDLLVIEEGDTVPADARLIESASLQTAESALTGESLPVPKDPAPLGEEAGISDRANMVFSGTAATYGHGTGVVTTTGMATEVGRIAGLLSRTTNETTPLQRELDRVGRRLGILVIAIAVVMSATILLTQPVDDLSAVADVLILAVALAVAAVPEGLPAVVTSTLAIGVRRIARRHAIVRKLPAVETLGSATVIASDKTGTLTRNEMTVRTVATAGGRTALAGSGYDPQGDVRPDGGPELGAELRAVLTAAERANNAALTRDDEGRWTVQGDPTEGALIVAARKAGLDPDVLALRWPRVGEVPFSSERKRMSTAHDDAERPGRRVLYTKGAADVVLGLCTAERRGDTDVPLSDARRDEILAANEALAADALRTLGIATRDLPAGVNPDDTAERELVFLGVVGMIDPPRKEAAEAVARARRAGIRPIMITGDHPATATAIARELGIAEPGGDAVRGADLQRMDDAQLDRTVLQANVYARVDPEHKLRIVEALQRDQQVVAMTGDGVNDAPALRTADIGVAMGITGTDVSKEAADMVLTDDNFATIVAAVEEGRAIFANIRKFLRYLLSSNIGEVMTMFAGVLLGGVIGLTGDAEGIVLPLLATQILWINLVTDGLPALALGLDPADPLVMERRPRPRGEGVITRRMWLWIVFSGAVMATGTLGVLAAARGGLLPGAQDSETARTLAFMTLVLFQLFNAFNARSEERSAFSGLFSSPVLWGAVLLSLALQVLVVYVPALQAAFATVPLTLAQWGVCALVASSVLWAGELVKLLTRRSPGAVAGDR